ncbi:MAG: hypothetical protein MUF77_07665 [Leptospira sp.]|nr:hypothetical protein [Leptospira sp.]
MGKRTTLIILLLMFISNCSYFKKDEDKTLGLLLLAFLSQDNGGCSGKKSGFTICIPKGIAE